MHDPKAILRTSANRAFTLIEIMVATVIMVILVGFFIQITSEVLKVWNRSSGKLAANAEARIAMDLLTRDLENAVFSNNQLQWLRAENTTLAGVGGTASNTVAVRMFSHASDSESPSGGICAIAYQLDYANPIDGSIAAPSSGAVDSRVFILYRLLVEPAPTFNDLMGTAVQQELTAQAAPTWSSGIIKGASGANYLACNIIEFEIDFHVMDDGDSSTPTLVSGAGASGATAVIYGGIGANVGPQATLVANQNPLVYAEITLKVISDEGMKQLQAIDLVATTAGKDAQIDEIILQNSETFIRRVNLASRPI